MNSLEDLQGALVGAWGGVSALAGCPLHFVSSPMGTEYPRAVFDLSSRETTVFGGAIADVELEIKILSAEASSEEVNDLVQAAKDLLAPATPRAVLTLAEHRVLKQPKLVEDDITQSKLEDINVWVGTLGLTLSIA